MNKQFCLPSLLYTFWLTLKTFTEGPRSHQMEIINLLPVSVHLFDASRHQLLPFSWE